ncbi:MAG: hypothetical protein ACXVLT_15030 [Flavisolibacter sp.]
MNSAQLHLALTHVPVLLSITGLIMLMVSFLIKNKTLTQTSFVVIALAGIAAIPVYLTGEDTEEVVENLPGVSEGIISRHAEVAMWATVSVAVAGVMALIAFFSFRWPAFAKISKVLVLVFSLATGVLMAQTAHLGGQIRHSEIRTGATAQSPTGSEGANEQTSGKDDD